MEEKLEEFRRRRRKERLFNKSKSFFRGIMQNISPSVMSDGSSPLLDNTSTSFEPVSESEVTTILSDKSIDISLSCPAWLVIFTYILYFLLWLVIYMIAIHFEFGFVYLILSGLVFIYLNTRTGPKKKGEISAYSVFNPNCQSIDGTLKAEQFEREFNLMKYDTSPK